MLSFRTRRLLVLAIGLVAPGSDPLSARAPLPDKDERTPAQIKAAQDDLNELRRLAREPKTEPARLWKLWQDFRIKHPGSPEWAGAAAVMAKVPSPLDRLDRSQIPPEDRPEWLPEGVVAVLGDQRGRHWEMVSRMVVSPDGQLVVSAGRHLRIWDAATLMEGPVVPSGPCAFAPKGRLLAVGNDKGASLWDLSGRRPREVATVAGHDTRPFVAFSGDGRLVTVSADKAIVWDIRGPKPVSLSVRMRQPPVWGRGIWRLSPDGRWLAQVDPLWESPSFRLWDLNAPSDREPFLLDGAQHPFAFAADGKSLATTTKRSRNRRIWDVSGDRPKPLQDLVGYRHQVDPLTFSPDGQFLVTGCQALRTLVIWPLFESGHKALGLKPGQAYAEHELKFTPYSAAFFPDGKTLVLGGTDGEVRLWDMARSAVRLPRPRGHTARVQSVAFSPDCRGLASGAQDETARLWDLSDGKPAELAALPTKGAWVQQVAFAPQGRHLAALSGSAYAEQDRNLVRLWDLSGDQPKEVFRKRSHELGVRNLAFSPDGKQVAVSGEDNDGPLDPEAPVRVGVVRLWALEDGTLVDRGAMRPPPDSEDTWPLQLGPFLTPGQRLLVGLGRDCLLWEQKDGKTREVTRIENERGARPPFALSPDGKVFALYRDTLIREPMLRCQPYLRLFDRSGTTFGERKEMLIDDYPDGLLFTHDAKVLIARTKFAAVRLYDVDTGRKLSQIDFPGDVLGMDLAPDGRHLATANANGTVYVFRLPLLFKKAARE
jgi:WD40 repeat protein